MIDRNPNVSPDGSVIVWEKCPGIPPVCDIGQAIKTTGGWGAATQVTNTPDDKRHPSTNGTVVVYETIPPGLVFDPHISWKPVAGGAESHLEMIGTERLPNISGNVISFQGVNISDPMPLYDIYLYDLATSTLYQVTDDTAPIDHLFSDISVTGTQARVVWTETSELGQENVYSKTVTLTTGGAGSVLDTLDRAISAINHLAPGSLKNANMAKAFTNKINFAIQLINGGLYLDAIDELQNDILAKTDGCVKAGYPDKNDWITNCTAQAEVYPFIVEAIALLKLL